MASRYSQSKERSAEVLRAVLGLMGQHAACFNPITFSVWYEYAAGMNAKLNRAIDERMLTKLVLGDDEMEQLHRDHVADPDDEAIRKINSEMLRVMSGVEGNASCVGASAGTFGDQIDRLTIALANGESSQLPAMLTGALAGAHDMKATMAALVQQIRDGRLEIEGLRAALSRARDEVLLDPLTGVLNRKGFDIRLAALMQQPRKSSHPHSLIMIDIDHFKSVNDKHGHVIGDQVIKGLAELLRRSVPDGGQSVTRYGGEEFAVLLPETSVADGVRLAERVRQQVSAMRIRDRRTQQVLMQVTISAGVAAMSSGDEPTTWIARADAALYRSKQAGRDRVMC